MTGSGESLPASLVRSAPSAPSPGTAPGAALRLEPAGRYRLERELARGGQGVVHVAWDKDLGRRVAFKVLSAAPGRAAAAQRFIREARITAQLEHAGIAPVHDVGVRADGSLYAAQKLVRGQTLDDVLVARTTLAGRLELLRPLQRICEAVAFAHARGVIHRDLKPANMILGELGEAVVLDWGLARTLGVTSEAGPGARPGERPPTAEAPRGAPSPEDLPTLDATFEHDLAATRDGAVLGTPAWMSPEQALGAASKVDARSDVWSLGAILYELLTGKRPFTGETTAALLAAVTTTEPMPVLSACPEAPPELAAVAERALRKNPQERYPSAAELAAELGAWLSGERVGAHDYTSWELVKKFFARNRLASGLGLVALVAVLAAAVGFRARYVESKKSLAEALLMSARNAARDLRWGEAAAYFAASRVQDDRREARLGLGIALHRAPTVRSDRTLEGEIKDLAFDGQHRPLALISESGAAVVRDAATGEQVLRVAREGSLVNTLAADGSAVALVSRRSEEGGRIEVLSLPGGALLGAHPLEVPKPGAIMNGIFQLGLAPGGRYFHWWSGSSWSAGTRTVRRTSDGKALVSLPGASLWAAFSADGESLVTRDVAGVALRIDLAHGTATSQLATPGRRGDFGALAAPPGGGAVSGTESGAIEQVGQEESSEWDHEHRTKVYGLKLSQDASTLASLSLDRTLVLWSATARVPRVRLEPRLAVPAFALSFDGSLLAEQRGPREVRVWEVPPETTVPWDGLRRASAAAISGDGSRVAVAGAPPSGAVEVYDAATGARVASLPAGTTFPLRQKLALSADGARLAVLGPRRTGVYALEVGRPPRLVCEAGRELPPVALSPAGDFLVVDDTDAGGPSLGRFSTAGCTAGWRAPLEATALAFTADGGRLAVGGADGRVHLLDADTGRTLRTWSLTGFILGIAVTRDGQRIAAAGESGAWMIDTGTGSVTSLGDRAGTPWSLAFSPDGGLLVASGTWLTLWSGETGRTLLALPADRATAFAGFAADGRTLFSFGHAPRREALTDDASTPPERQLADVLARYRLKLVGQRVVEDEPAPPP